MLATLSLEAIERLRLAVGSPVSPFEERIAHEAAQLRTYDRALTALAFRARSSAELARVLVRKGEPKELVARAVERLQTQGLLDDAAYAEAFVRSRVLGARESRRRVQQALTKKGVPPSVSEAAVDAVFADEGIDQSEVVVQAARKKLRSLSKLEPAVRRRRLYAYLARRGYDADDIRRAMNVVGEEAPAPE